jgi:ribosome-associated protein
VAPRSGGRREDPERAAIRKAFAAINPAEPTEVARLVSAALLDKKGDELVVLDVTGRTSYCDLIVLCNGSSARQVGALAKGVLDAFRDATGQRPLGVEGQEANKWVLVDLGDVIVHVFQSNLRSHYDLDGLWMDAARLSLQQLGLNEKGEPLSPPAAIG